MQLNQSHRLSTNASVDACRACLNDAIRSIKSADRYFPGLITRDAFVLITSIEELEARVKRKLPAPAKKRKGGRK
jgi:hypothetical protein